MTLTSVNLTASLPFLFSSKGWTGLHVAAFTNNVRLAELLVRHGANINHLSNSGETPLQVARNAQHHQVASYLCSCFPVAEGEGPTQRGTKRKRAEEREECHRVQT